MDAGASSRKSVWSRPIRKLRQSILDLGIVLLASVIALIVRDDTGWGALLWQPNVQLYILVSLLVSLPVGYAFGTHRTFWRFSAASDFVRVGTAAAVTVAMTMVLVFWLSRLEGVSRSLPILQFFFITFLQGAGRMAMRGRHSLRQRQGRIGYADVPGNAETALVLGINNLTELYLRAAEERAGETLSIVGVLGGRQDQTGRSLRRYPILARVDEVRNVLRDLEVHGVKVRRVVVTEPVKNLSSTLLADLSDIEKTTDVRIEFLAEVMGLERREQAFEIAEQNREPAMPHYGLSALEALSLKRRPYVAFKRTADCVLASTMLAALAPVMAVTAVMVAINVGRPVLFWQVRPGLSGRDFKLYKFRTMGPGHDARGRKRSDAERVSITGRLLRRTRLDELPQLWNIAIGQMSFVGPRPLLPVDQDSAFLPRLYVRPGLTGWAQVNGGRLVSTTDKGAMDVLYVRRLSFMLDLRIILKTIPMVLFKERSNSKAVEDAWATLIRAQAENNAVLHRAAASHPGLEAGLSTPRAA